MKEHQNLEWKEVWRDEHLKWVCAFANGEGGTLVIGRNDKGKVVGVANATKLLEDLPNKIRDLLGIMVNVNLRCEGGKDVLEVVTPAYPAPISYRGHYYHRSGSTLQELKGTALDRFRSCRLRDEFPVARAACPCENTIMGGPPMPHFIPKPTRAIAFYWVVMAVHGMALRSLASARRIWQPQHSLAFASWQRVAAGWTLRRSPNRMLACS